MKQHTRTGGSRHHSLSSAESQRVQMAMSMLQRRQAADAEALLQASLAQAPGHPEVLRLLAIALRMQDRHAEALPLLQQAAASRPDDALIQNSLGTALDMHGDIEAAHAALQRACELAPHATQMWSNLGKFLGDHGRFEQAVPVLERVLGMAPHDASQLRLAHALRVLGRTDEAARRYRELIALQPADGFAWLGLAGLKTRTFAAADIGAMQNALGQPELSGDDRISIHFALAKALDDHGHDADAFAHYVSGNRLVREIRPWNAAQFSALTDEVLTAFAAPPAAAAADSRAGVIFIVSMPRSGSSLIEQMLASHPEVVGGGELDALGAVIQTESQRRQQDFPRWVAHTSAEDWQRLGREYMLRTRHLQQPGKLFTDKMPGNWLRVGAALAMLPGARVIDCRRNALETCLSCFRTLFMEGAQAFTYDLEDLAAYWHDCNRASHHWQTHAPDRVRVQAYESLIADPGVEIDALLAFCGLPHDPACERYYETPRAVTTASASQVREPLMRDTARADRYGAALDVLRAALAKPARSNFNAP